MAADTTGLDRLPSGRWRARYKDADGRAHSKSFPTVTEARRWRRAQVATVDAGLHVAPNDTTTVREFAARWSASRPHRESTRRQVGTYLRHLDDSGLGSRPLRLVRPSMVQEFVSNRSAAGYSPQTIRNVYTWLRAVFTAAVEDRLIAHSPCTRAIKQPKVPKVEVVPLEVEQVRALHESMCAVAPRYAIGVLLQAALGLRVSELLALRVDDVDFLRRTVRVERQLDRRGRSFVAPKSEHGYRTVPLATSVVEALSVHVGEHPPTGSGLLLSTPYGNPLRQDLYTCKHFRAAVQGAASVPSGTVPHDLRHHFASVLLRDGVPANVVAKFLGHGSAALVLSTYGHVMPGAEDLTRRSLDALWSGSVTGVSRRGLTAP